MSDNSPQFVFANTVERRNAFRVSKMEETILDNTFDNEEERDCESITAEEKRPWPKTNQIINTTENS